INFPAGSSSNDSANLPWTAIPAGMSGWSAMSSRDAPGCFGSGIFLNSSRLSYRAAIASKVPRLTSKLQSRLCGVAGAAITNVVLVAAMALEITPPGSATAPARLAPLLRTSRRSGEEIPVPSRDMIRGMHLTCYLNIHSHRYLAQLRYSHQATSNNSRFDACFLSGLKPLPTAYACGPAQTARGLLRTLLRLRRRLDLPRAWL